MAFYVGGIHAIPPSEYDCLIYGRLKRAIRDSKSLATTFWGGLVAALSITIGTSLALVVFPPPSSMVGLRETVAGFAAGMMLGILILTSFSFLPRARDRHWRIDCQRHPRESTGHSLLVIHSKCYHELKDPQCTVVDPDGKKWKTNVNTHEQTPPILGPGQSYQVQYPEDFDAPCPKAGTYKVTFTSMTCNGKKRVTLSRRKWQVSSSQ